MPLDRIVRIPSLETEDFERDLDFEEVGVPCLLEVIYLEFLEVT